MNEFAGVRFALFVLALVLGALLEARFSRRARQARALPRWAANLGLLAVGVVALPLIVPIFAVPFAHWAEERRVGVLHWVSLPYPLKFLLGFVWLDFAIYWQHRLFHETPFLWRSHRVHHADLDLDASSGARFHPTELAISMAFKWAAIAALGVHFLAVAGYEAALNFFSILQHSAIDLGRLDAPLRRVLVTPDYHRVHHSPERDETDSNYSFLFSIWDRLFGTYRPQPRADHATMPLGLPSPRDEKTCASIPAMLALPFKARP